MARGPATEAPFDPRWLDLLVETCGAVARTSPRLEDLFLERRLEVRVSRANGLVQVETSHSEGSAARWRFPTRRQLQAASGSSPQVVNELVSRYASDLSLPAVRPLPPPELDAPRGWLDWARGLADRLARPAGQVCFVLRSATVIREDGWSAVSSPPLVRVHRGGDDQAALLAVWPHPELTSWLTELAEAPPSRLWSPDPGQQLPVLFRDGAAGALIHELVGHMVESDLALAGTTPLGRLAGIAVTTPSLSIVDDPTRVDLPGAFTVDDEGVSAEPRTVVSNGVLTGWLCDRHGAEVLGMPPGRGRRSSWRHPPTARLSNLVVAGGETPVADLEGDLGHGLVVTRVRGAAVDPVSARTVIRVDRGWEVRHGRRRRPLSPCALTGSVLEVLAHMDPNLGAETMADWRLGWCIKAGRPLPTGAETPAILVHRLEVL